MRQGYFLCQRSPFSRTERGPSPSSQRRARDGVRDLIVHFEVEDLKLTPGATKARLEGKTLDQRVIWGEDAIRIVH